MEKVVTFSLNGNAYQVEENGFAKIMDYMNHAKAQLKNNDDAAEIIADLEQAIAEKCARYLSPRKNVVKASEIEEVIREMGPVVVTENEEAQTGAAASTSEPELKTEPMMKKRLYQIQEGAWITGLCKGLSVYLELDVKMVRIAVVLLALLSNGWGFLVYLLGVLLVPFAKTSEDIASAEGMPFNAQSLVDRAIGNYSRLRDDKNLHTRWRTNYGLLRTRFNDETKAWMHGFKHEPGYQPRITAGALALMPVFGLIRLGLFILLVVALIGAVTQGLVFGFAIPSTIPLWAAVIGLVVGYNLISAPFHLTHVGPGYRSFTWRARVGLMEAAVTIFAFWFAYQNFPEVRQFVQDLPNMTNAAADWIRANLAN